MHEPASGAGRARRSDVRWHAVVAARTPYRCSLSIGVASVGMTPWVGDPGDASTVTQHEVPRVRRTETERSRDAVAWVGVGFGWLD
jgi:hypothetical protein